MFKCLLSLALLITSSLTSLAQEHREPNDVIDPMKDVVPIDIQPSPTDINSPRMEISQEVLDPPLPKPASMASKRFADERQLVIHTQPRHNNRRSSSTETKDQVTEECAYTFIVSGEAAQTTTCGDTKQRYLTEIQEDILAAKVQVEEIRNEISEEKRRLSNSHVISAMQEKISHLERESVNMDQRVSQLYMQLLHEIINKRDNAIEVQELEKKLLNQTIRYYQLLENHNRLQRNHKALQELVNNQSEDIQSVRQQIDQLSLQMTNCQCSDETRSGANPTIARPCQDDNEANVLPSSRTNFPPGPFRDCTQVQRAGYITSGTFNLKLPGYSKKIRVWCDLDQDPGGWIVIQRRSGRRIKFSRNMNAYQHGFGRPHSDHWLGLENLHQLTNQSGINYKLQVELEDWYGRKKFAEYQSFRVGHESTGYQLKIAHYSGNAGDSLTWHNNMAFTTNDVDNDLSETNCATTNRGGWWYRDCARSNLNGIYYRGGHYMSRNQDGVYWTSWRGTIYSLKNVVMKIRTLE